MSLFQSLLSLIHPRVAKTRDLKKLKCNCWTGGQEAWGISGTEHLQHNLGICQSWLHAIWRIPGCGWTSSYGVHRPWHAEVQCPGEGSGFSIYWMQWADLKSIAHCSSGCTDTSCHDIGSGECPLVLCNTQPPAVLQAAREDFRVYAQEPGKVQPAKSGFDFVGLCQIRVRGKRHCCIHMHLM